MEALATADNALALDELLKEFADRPPEKPMVLYLARPMHYAILHFWPEAGATWEQPERAFPAGPDPRSAADRWDWLWEGVSYDLPKLAAKVGAPEYVVRSRVAIFAAWRWLFPNGQLAPKLAAMLAEWNSGQSEESSKPSRSKPN